MQVRLHRGRIVAAGDLRLTLPDGWMQARSGPNVPGFEGAHAAFARSWNADVAIALLPAVRRSLLPRALDAMKSPTSSRPTVVRAGALRGYHYFRAAKGQRVLELVVAPTTHGIARSRARARSRRPASAIRRWAAWLWRTASSSR